MRNKQIFIAVVLILITTFSFTRITNSADLIIDADTTWESGGYTFYDVLITNGATLTFNGAVTLNAQNLTINLGSSISADEKGYGSAEGPGAGSVDGYRGSGGGYGGEGGAYGSAAGGSTYGSETAPIDLGSGGGVSGPGGPGGGAIRIIIGNTLAIYRVVQKYCNNLS